MRIMVMSVLCALVFSSPVLADDGADRQFSELDRDRDDYLTKEEFADEKMQVNRRKAVKLFPDMRDVEHMNDRALKDSLFERMDRNNDGVLSRDEWRKVAPNILEMRF